MRPLELEVEGFTSFNNPTHVDFNDLDLFAITGPTGAGKSSLIDAICYALYGRIPRVGREVTSCIRAGHERMRATLEFSAGDDTYRVLRETRRRGSPNVRLDRWENSDWTAVADRAAQADRIIEAALGLDYDSFIRSVMLPQGEFEKLLAGEAKDRRAVLGRLLRLDVYEIVRSRATELAKEHKSALDHHNSELERLADATPESVTGLQTEIAETRVLIDELTAQTQKLNVALELSQERDKACAREVSATAEAKSALDALGSARQLIDEGKGRKEALVSEGDRLEGQISANPFDADLLIALGVAIEKARDGERAAADLAKLEDASTRYAKALAESVDSLKKANVAVEGEKTLRETATRQLQDAQRQDLAAALSSGLKPGDLCPVCGEKVVKLVQVYESHLAQAEQALTKATAREGAAVDAANRTQQQQMQAESALGTARSQAAELRERVATLKSELKDVLPGDGERTTQRIAKEREQQLAAQTTKQRLESELAAVTRQIENLSGQMEQLAKNEGDLVRRAEVAEQALDEAAKTVVKAESQLMAVTDSWADFAMSDEATTALRRRLSETQEGRSSAMVRAGQMEERLKHLEQAVQRAETLRADAECHKLEYNTAAEIANILRADRFQTWLQSQALQTLAQDGSRRLAVLSNGRYLLKITDDTKDFEVIDKWNADQVRSVKTLSGGETFIASLALALALAESLPSLAASGRVVLDSIFLDEGFGSLDPEALNLAADALDALRTENRMVCVITHLQELAERLPARIVVTKTDTGSTVAVA